MTRYTPGPGYRGTLLDQVVPRSVPVNRTLTGRLYRGGFGIYQATGRTPGRMMGLAAAASVLVLQAGPEVDVALGEGLAGGAVGAFVTTLVVGAILVAVAPSYTERLMRDVLEDPVGSFVYGFASLLVLFVLAVLLAITIVGIVFALPMLLVAYVVWAVGAAIAYLAIGERLVGRDDGWLKPLVVGAGINGLLAVTGVGGLVSVCIGAAGFGVVLRSWLA